MTDKEIIINGIDVSKCTHIDNWKYCNCCNDLIKTIYPKATKCHIEEDLRCEIYPNCYFKQLKRKEQECEKLKKRLESFQKDYSKLYQVVENKGYIKELDQLKQTLTEIKEIAEPFCNACQEFEPEKSKNCINCTYCNYNKILQKISEVLKDE